MAVSTSTFSGALTDDFTVTAGYSNNLNIYSGQFRASYGDASLGSAKWKTATRTFGNDQYAEVTIAGTSAYTGAIIGVCVRHDTGAYTSSTDSRKFYGAFLEDDSGTDSGHYITLLMRNNGTSSINQSAPVTFVAGAALRLQVVGSALKVYYNGAEVTALATTDSTLASGQPGIIANLQTTTWLGDNFAADEVVGGGGSVAPLAAYYTRMRLS